MPVSIKFMLFSMIGSVLFLVVSVFFPFLAFISTGFWIIAALSLATFIFKTLQTRHHFLKSAIGFGIGTVFIIIIHFAYEMLGVNQHSDILFVQINKLICLNGAKACFLITVCDLLILVVDYLLTWTVSLAKEREVIPFILLRVAIYVTYVLFFGSLFVNLQITVANVILQILLVFSILFDVIALMILLSSKTVASVRSRLLLCNLFALLLSTMLYYHINQTGDYISEFFQLGQVDTAYILQVVCNIMVLLLILQSFIYMLISIFKPKSSILYCFSPVMYAAIGLLISGCFYYKGNLVSFYLTETGIIYYISMICFAIGIAVSFLSAAYKLIFTKTETTNTDKFNIDPD